MTPIPQDPPLRTFTVYDRVGSAENFSAHAPRVGDCGALELLTYVGGMVWTTDIFPNGTWSRVAATTPTRDEVQAIQNMNDEADRETQRRMQGLVAMNAGPSKTPGGQFGLN